MTKEQTANQENKCTRGGPGGGHDLKHRKLHGAVKLTIAAVFILGGGYLWSRVDDMAFVWMVLIVMIGSPIVYLILKGRGASESVVSDPAELGDVISLQLALSIMIAEGVLAIAALLYFVVRQEYEPKLSFLPFVVLVLLLIPLHARNRATSIKVERSDGKRRLVARKK